MHILWFLGILGVVGIITMVVMGLSVKTDPHSNNLLIRCAIALSVMGTISLIISCVEGFGPPLRAYEAQGHVLQASDPWFKWLTTILLAIGWCILSLAICIASIAKLFSRPSRELSYVAITDAPQHSFFKDLGKHLLIHILAYSIVGFAVIYVLPNIVTLWRYLVRSFRR